MRAIRFASLLVSTTLITLPGTAEQHPDPASWVNAFIGTTNGGNVFPGATVPFGMVQFSPEASPYRTNSMIAAPGGYEYRSTKIRGFSLTNVEGWGCAGGSGDVPFMPITEAVTQSPSTDFRNAYAAGFTHADEQAHPGYYGVNLANGVQAELSASTRTGSAVFHFPSDKPAALLVRTSDSEVGSTAAHTSIDTDAHTITGSVTSGNFCGYISQEDRRSYYTLYFAAEFDQPFTGTGAWHDTTVTPDAKNADGGSGFGKKGFPDKGQGSGVWVTFKDGEKVHVRIGISYVSEANAKDNLVSENPAGTPFEDIRDKARSAWNAKLNQISITGGTDDQKTVFATALYHSQMTPTVSSDANGEYKGMDGQVHKVPASQKAQYANFSGWDVYRSQFQLLTWLDPKLGSDIAQSLYNQAQQNDGVWDRWTHNTGSTHVMNGDPAAPALADVWAFGGREFDAKGALQSLVHAADVPNAGDLSKDGCPVECKGQRPGLDQWLKLHYIPVGAPAWAPAADTLEDVTAEFGISALAGHLGDKATEKRFLERAQYWRNIWNPKAAPEGGYFQNRNADGTWAQVQDDDDDKAPRAFTPATGDGFVEGTAAQYVWMIPFNVNGLFNAMGGMDKATARLDRFFYDDKGAPAVTKSGPLHAELDNEPSIETPWLYDFAGQPWKTQQLVRQVLNTIWTNTPKGIPGNDDLGEMSSWAVFASMGFYPEIPGRAELVLGSPLFPSITVHRPGGDVKIEAEGAATDSPYVVDLTVNGKKSDRTWLPESFALEGGTLHFKLASTPNKQWGAGLKNTPPSFDAK